MKSFLALLIAAFAYGCSEPPAPKPAPKPAVEIPAPVQAKPVEEPKPDPNKELARRVKKTLEEEAKIQAAGIDVTAADGAVTLWGTAASETEKRRAAQAAAKVDGVKTVDNRLTVVRGS